MEYLRLVPRRNSPQPEGCKSGMNKMNNKNKKLLKKINIWIYLILFLLIASSFL